MANLNELMEVFSTPYKTIVTQRENGRTPIADTIIEVADRFIPSHRERSGHVGYFGYSRAVENTESVGLPRAIKYVAALMALGIPPELIGMGQGLRETRERGLEKELEELLPYLKNDLSKSLRFVDEDAVQRFAADSEAWAAIRDDIRSVAEYTGEKPGPQTADEMRHLTHTRNFVDLYRRFNGDPAIAEEMTDEALKAAKLRQYLG